MNNRLRRIITISVLLITGSLVFAAFQIISNGSEESGLSYLSDNNFESVISQPGQIIFQDEKGEEISLSSLRGKVVFINFWATWCLPCRAEMPSISRLRRSYSNNKDIIFLMVDVEGNFKKSEKFLKKRKLDLPVFVAKSNLPPVLLNGAIPTTVILNKNGQIAFRVEGAVDYSTSKVRKALDVLIKERS